MALPTRHRAVARAQQACRNHSQRYRPHCEKLIWVRNACAAAAYRVRNGVLKEYGGAYARYQGPAKSKALRKVRGPGHRHIWTWVCTSRRYGRAEVGTKGLDDLVAYTRSLQHPDDRGGFPLWGKGPTTEGGFALVVGLGAVLVTIGWIGNKARTVRRD